MWFGRISVALEHMECLCSRSFDPCPDVEASQVFVPTTDGIAGTGRPIPCSDVVDLPRRRGERWIGDDREEGREDIQATVSLHRG